LSEVLLVHDNTRAHACVGITNIITALGQTFCCTLPTVLMFHHQIFTCLFIGRQPARAPLRGRCESTECHSPAISEGGGWLSPDRSTCCCSNMEADFCWRWGQYWNYVVL